ncbi:cupredoxin family protein [Betaproteobacteria bacterium SCN2]|jgi:uncharacterized cupredoxin-like copper-binding protein|nr:cupredoxin family protein [Betaproteobacteria bacterium SCN2]
MRRRQILAALLALGAAAAHAHSDKKHAPAVAHQAEQKDWGILGERRAVTRAVTVDMTDNMRFRPDSITVREGDTVRFIVRNKGRMLHEMVIGTASELKEHAALMAKYPNMEHDEPWMLHVDPGKTGEIVWNFNRPGAFEFACLIAGHYEAGMRGTITVTPKQR